MNSTDAGFNSILKSYCYDQFSYGTSGIGVFKSKEFQKGQSECCLTFKPYGVYNSCYDEGANSKINVVYTAYNWTVNRIVEEFCIYEGEFKEEEFKTLPEAIRRDYEAGQLNKKHKLIYGILPNNFYQMNLRGKNGAKFKGYWFLSSSNKIFKVDYFNEMPIAVCRFIRVNNQVYGESSGSLSISSIKMLNHIKGDTIDNIEKITDSPLGVLSGALVAGNVLNRSAGGVTVFNPQGVANGQSPVFPLSQSGDISAVVNFLMPELKKDIVNNFKIDQLLDFNNSTAMTATESSYRMGIRGKSISGVLSQQVTEGIEPTVHRAISVIQDSGLYGITQEEAISTILNGGYVANINPDELQEKIASLENMNIIPDVVANAMRDNKRWYKIKFNGELEKLANAELYESIGRFLQYFASIYQIDPNITLAINSYEFLDMLKHVSNLQNDGLVKSKTEFSEIIEQMQAQQQAQQEAQMQMQAVGAMQGMAKAGKDSAETQNIMQQGDMGNGIQ